MNTSLSAQQFQDCVLAWYARHGRKQLPWQQQQSAYHVWLSEIMLQQTQVRTVIDYFTRFITAYPTIADLAKAPLDHVLHLWSGLGYYARARNLHRSATIITHDYAGEFPKNVTSLQTLPGIGRSTAGAIVALAYQQPAAILDGNVKRLFARFFGIHGWPGTTAVANELWHLAETYKSQQQPRAYTQVLMDLGALICTRGQAQCERCPLQRHCYAYAHQCVDQLPHRKPKKTLPEKQWQFMIFIDADNRVLLTKRAPMGIWGGLWSFPSSQQPSREALTEFATRYQLILQSHVVDLPTFRHSFSHFHLTIHPIVWRVKRQCIGLQEANQYDWLPIAAPITDKGLAKPMLKLWPMLNHYIQQGG